MLSTFHAYHAHSRPRRTQPDGTEFQAVLDPSLSLTLSPLLFACSTYCTCILCLSCPSAAPPLVPNPINLALASDARPGLLSLVASLGPSHAGAGTCLHNCPPTPAAHANAHPINHGLVQSKTRRPFLSTGNSNHHPIGPTTAETPAQLHSIRLASLFSTTLHSLDTIYLLRSNTKQPVAGVPALIGIDCNRLPSPVILAISSPPFPFSHHSAPPPPPQDLSKC